MDQEAENLFKDLIFKAIKFEIDNFQVKPQAIYMEDKLHKMLDKPSEIQGINIIIDDGLKHRWEFKF